MSGSANSRKDSSQVVETPEGIEFVLYPAGLPIRACAWAIDVFIQGILMLAIIITFGILGRVLGIWFFLILLFALDWFYHMAFEVLGHGQSPGKRFMGIRVVRGDGSPVNPGASFLRNLLRFADTFLFLYLIAFICMLVSPGFRRLGDWAADTLVVYTANARIPLRFGSRVFMRSAVMPWLEGLKPAPASIKLDYEEKQALLMFARRYPLLGKARADEIAGIWADQLRGDEDPETESASAYLLGLARHLGG
ncbi:MAG: RDD family protein [Treponema sp.]|nr:RDD family protein [Treponema sp.]